MIIFESPFAMLEHDPVLNLLKVTYRDLRGLNPSDMAEFMRHAGECATAHGVKGLLLDSSRSFNPMPEGEVEAVFRRIVEACQAFGIERLARVESPSLVSELNAREGIDRVSQTEPHRFALRTFHYRTEAMRWLAPS